MVDQVTPEVVGVVDVGPHAAPVPLEESNRFHRPHAGCDDQSFGQMLGHCDVARHGLHDAGPGEGRGGEKGGQVSRWDSNQRPQGGKEGAGVAGGLAGWRGGGGGGGGVFQAKGLDGTRQLSGERRGGGVG